MDIKKRCQSGFEKLLRKFSMADLEDSDNTIFGLWSDFTIGYFNPGWVKFAKENGAPRTLSSSKCLGMSVIDVCAEELRPFYKRLYKLCLSTKGKTQEPFEYEYECSSPTLYRRFVMALYALDAAEGILVVNSLALETKHSSQKALYPTADISEYINEKGIIIQCAHCRRVQHRQYKNRWDWVQQWVKTPPEESSHGLCSMCFDYYYPPEPITES